jgi:NDP-sugar pyrophosphorylase family protein
MNDVSAWPALILTAGLATRLRPVSSVRAKAAMPVAGKPIIGRILEWLHAAGVQRVVLNLHYRPETITGLVGEGAEWGVDVRYSWEGRALGSAGGPRRALPMLDADRFLVINGDTLTNCDLAGLVRRHLATRARVTMAVVPGDIGRYGGVLVDPDGRVTGFARAAAASSTTSTLPSHPPAHPVRSAWHFIGVQAVDAGVFDGLPDNEPCETVRTLYPQLIARNAAAISAFQSEAEFLDVGTLADYHRTVATVAAREGVSFDVGADCSIDRDALVQDSILWDRVIVPTGSQLINCIVTDDVSVPAAERFERSALIAGDAGLVVQKF